MDQVLDKPAREAIEFAEQIKSLVERLGRHVEDCMEDDERNLAVPWEVISSCETAAQSPGRAQGRA